MHGFWVYIIDRYRRDKGHTYIMGHGERFPKKYILERANGAR